MKFSFSGSCIARSKILQAASHFSKTPGTLFFYSGQNTDAPSYLFLFPNKEIIIESKATDPWKTLKEEMGLFKGENRPLWAGYLGYEMGAYQDESLTLPHSPSPYPLAHMQRSEICLVQKGAEIELYTDSLSGSAPKELLGEEYWHSFFEEGHTALSFEPSFSPSQQEDFSSYLNKIEIAKEYIRSGDVYQVNLSRSVKREVEDEGFEIFERLSQSNPVDYSAYMNLGDFEVISASPELFLQKTGRRIETRPIKGTIARGKEPLSDALQKEQLLSSTKENAELMMICDLMRNDLGQISEVGTVRCTKKKHLLTLSNVYHLESHVESVATEMHPLDLIQKCFPAGSITGCPKIRSMQIIHELEKRPRHIYCGSIGFFKANGDFTFNVAIRTGVLKERELELQVGGAITYDSSSQAEYRETQSKGSPFDLVLTQKKSKRHAPCS